MENTTTQNHTKTRLRNTQNDDIHIPNVTVQQFPTSRNDGFLYFSLFDWILSIILNKQGFVQACFWGIPPKETWNYPSKNFCHTGKYNLNIEAKM